MEARWNFCLRSRPSEGLGPEAGTVLSGGRALLEGSEGEVLLLGLRLAFSTEGRETAVLRIAGLSGSPVKEVVKISKYAASGRLRSLRKTPVKEDRMTQCTRVVSPRRSLCSPAGKDACV